MEEELAKAANVSASLRFLCGVFLGFGVFRV